ncbi:MAG: glycosyltransferase [Kiritimatiellae bacterium]|nr:glycosyltransferase [Kiritimatiellia bacterium]
MKNGSVESMESLVEKRMACVLCARPGVVVAYESDFIKRREVFEAFARANPGGCVLVQLGWECETPESVGRLAAAAAAFREGTGGARLVTMCNSAAEMEALGKAGMETRWIHQNALMDERRFRPMGGGNRPFDAAYIARLTPFKRHGLVPAELAPRLLFLGAGVRASERGYADEMHAKYPAARWVEAFSGSKISCLLARAKCGLALSAVEGACFASAEYLLSGLPVVDTPSIGGRDVVMPDEYVRRVEPEPNAIAAGIAHWVAHRPDPWKVRAAFLAKAAPHREKYRQLMKELTGHDCRRPPHKLGLRTPHPGVACTLAIQAYLFAKGLAAR